MRRMSADPTADAGADAQAALGAADAQESPRVGGPARRPPLLVQGAAGATLLLALAGLAVLGTWPLLAGVLALQLLLVLGFLALVDAPADGGAFVVAAGTAIAADAVVVTGNGTAGGLTGTTALAFVAALVHQLARRRRTRVTESLADTLVVVALVTAAATLLALRETTGGREALVVALVAGAASLLAGRVGDRIAPGPVVAVGASRGWPGLVLGLGAGVLAAALVGGDDGAVIGGDAALLGLAVAAAAVAGDLAVDLGGSELRAGWRDARRVAALRPVSLLLPAAVLAPVAYVAGRLVLL